MSPSFKVLPVAFLAASASALSFTFPAPGTNTVNLEDQDTLTVSIQDAARSTFALNCGSTADFTTGQANRKFL
jgi:hypothetical protein